MKPNSPSKEDSTKDKEKKEPESSKDKDKSSTLEEDFHIKSELKDESSERSASIRESSGSNSYQNRSGSLQRNMRNSETDLDKIIAGKDEGRLNSNSNLDSKDQRRSEQDKNIVSNFYLGNLLKGMGFRKTLTRKERKSVFLNMAEEKDKDTNLRDLINARLNELKDSTLSFFLQSVKELENKYNETKFPLKRRFHQRQRKKRTRILKRQR